MPLTPWNTAREEIVKRMWADGHSAGDIADRLGGMSRSAVLGKVRRLGLAERATTSRMKSPKRAVPRAPRSRGQAPCSAPQRPRDELGALQGLPLPMPEPEDIPRIATLDLLDRHCRWPCVPDPLAVPAGAPIFCGATRALGLPYCDVHRLRAYSSPEVSRPDMVPVPVPAREMEEA